MVRKLEVTKADMAQKVLRQEMQCCAQLRFAHRLHCILLVGAGGSCYEVAKVFGDNPRSVERWVRQFQRSGITGLKEKPHPGRHPKLADEQMRQLEFVLDDCPRKLGYPADVWSNRLLRAEILYRFGVTLSGRHCQRLLKTLRQSYAQQNC